MKNAFGQEISDGMLLVSDEYEKYLNDLSEEKDIRPLAKAVGYHMRMMGRNLPLHDVGLCFAVLYFRVMDFECGWFKRSLIVFLCWVMRAYAYRGRPMWNDFYMCLWQLSLDPRYVGKLYEHLKRGSPVQKETGEWMIGSVCQQDPLFAEHWADLIGERGQVFDGDLMRMIHQGPAKAGK